MNPPGHSEQSKTQYPATGIPSSGQVTCLDWELRGVDGVQASTAQTVLRGAGAKGHLRPSDGAHRAAPLAAGTDATLGLQPRCRAEVAALIKTWEVGCKNFHEIH